MKKVILMLLAAVLAPLQAGALDIANAQVHEVVDAPEWFFNPAQGEYVGVSLPLKNAELAQQQVVYAALLSYVAQSNVVVNFQNAANSTAISEEAEHLVEVVSENLFILPSSYKLTKTAVNQYGEHFVSLSVAPSIDSSIQVLVGQYLSHTKKNGVEKNKDERMFLIEDKSSPNVEVNVYGSYTSQGDSTAEEQVMYGVEHVQADEIFVPEKKYGYSSTMSGEAAQREPFWGMFPLQYSLGVAYTQALLNGIIHDCVSGGKRTSTDLSKITKPAREAIKAEIVEGKLVLFATKNTIPEFF